MKKIIILIAVCLMLCGCKEAPEEVKENMKEYGENEQIKEETQLSYCKPGELKNADIKDIDVKESSIKLPDNIDFSEVSDVELLKIKLGDNYIDNNIGRLAELFGVSEEKFEETKSYLNGRYVVGRDEQLRKEVGIIDNGFVAYVAGTQFTDDDNQEPDLENIEDIENIEMYSGPELAAVYHEETDDFSSIDIPFENGNEKLSVMCEKAEKFYKDNFVYDSKVDYRITDAAVFDNGHLSLNGEWFYKGISFNDHQLYATDGEEYDYAFFNNVETNYDDKDLMSVFAIHNFQFIIEETEKPDKIIDFKSAVSLVNNKFASFNNLRIDEVVPLYFVLAHCKPGTNAEAPGTVYEARPVYAFLTKKKMKLSTEDYMNPCGYEDKFIAVDMITGEILTDYDNYTD